MNTPKRCACYFGDGMVRWCALHASAEELQSSLKDLTDALTIYFESVADRTIDLRSWDKHTKDELTFAKTALAHAEGKP